MPVRRSQRRPSEANTANEHPHQMPDIYVTSPSDSYDRGSQWQVASATNDDIVRVIPSPSEFASVSISESEMTLQQSLAPVGWSLEDLENLIFKQPLHSPSKCQRRLKRRLRYFFMSPVEKWRKARTFPFKLCLELFKIAIITLQLMSYGYDRAVHRKFHDGNIQALRHIFQPSWRHTVTDSSCYNCVDMFTTKEVHASLNHFVNAYYNIQNIPVGNYFIDPDPETNQTKLLTAEITSLNFTSRYNEDGQVYEIDANKETDIVTLLPGENPSWPRYYYGRRSQAPISLDLSNFLYIALKFDIHAVAYHRVLESRKPSCTTFHLQMTYDNSERAGTVQQQLLITSTFEQPCKSNVVYFGYSSNNPTWKYSITGVVIVACLGSLILCGRSAIRAERLRRVTAAYFDKYLNRDFLWSEGGFEFVDLWLYLILLTDLLLLSGSVCWIILLQQHQIDMYDEIAILIGTGTLLSWFSILRYLNYYQKLSLLLLTLKRAFPEVLRFSLCAVVIFCGYILFGWIVLGPHTIKFKSVWVTAEQLFSLMNGDDLKATFASVNYGNSALIWLVSRLYLYSFLSLYIYVVLSLFIAIIIDVYEDIKNRWKTKRFRPHSQTLRLLLCGNLGRLSDKERREVALKRKEPKHRRITKPSGNVELLRRCVAKCFGKKAKVEMVADNVVSIDSSQYNLPGPSVSRPVAMGGGDTSERYASASSSTTTEEEISDEDHGQLRSSLVQGRQRPPSLPTNEVSVRVSPTVPGPRHDTTFFL